MHIPVHQRKMEIYGQPQRILLFSLYIQSSAKIPGFCLHYINKAMSKKFLVQENGMLNLQQKPIFEDEYQKEESLL